MYEEMDWEDFNMDKTILEMSPEDRKQLFEECIMTTSGGKELRGMMRFDSWKQLLPEVDAMSSEDFEEIIFRLNTWNVDATTKWSILFSGTGKVNQTAFAFTAKELKKIDPKKFTIRR